MNKPVDVEVAAVPDHPVASMVAQGLRIVKIENETQQVMAVQRPRNEAEVFEKAVQELSLAPDFAKRSFYSIPYKKKEGGTQLVEGPSIKAAMSLARRWGNNSNGARVVDEMDDRIIVEGVFLDYETNMRTLRQVSVPRVFKDRATNTYKKLPEDRMNLAIQAGMSKAVRNAILASLPSSLVDLYFSEAKKVAAGLTGKNAKAEPVKDRIDKAVAAFVKKGATRGAVESYINGLSFETAEEVLTHLLGLYNAVNDGVQTIQDIFGGEEPAKPAVQGQIKTGDILG